MMQYDYDVLIIGGGLAGNCLALALKDTGLNIAVIEANSREQRYSSPAGDRALALASGTVHMLEALGIWQGVKKVATPIERIHVSDQGHFGKTRLSAAKEGVRALGYVIVARELEDHVASMVELTDVKQICPATVIGLMSGIEQACVSLKMKGESLNLSARIVVGADGGNSSVRHLLNIAQQKKDYGQAAIVTTVKSEISHQFTAYERFTKSGPLAMLPADKDHFAVVWTRTQEDAENLLTVNEAEFIHQLQECFGFRLGKLILTAPRRAFPLSLVRAEKMLSGRAVIIGNAVHQLHPVAGQGFNLGLRDVVQLAELLILQQRKRQDLGDPDLLASYAKSRQKDHDRVAGFTDNLVRIFSNDWLSVALARNAGLVLLDNIPSAKGYLARYAMGLAGRMSRIGSKGYQ